MVNWCYTLWKRDYDDGASFFVSSVARGGTGSPTGRPSLEGLAKYYYQERVSTSSHGDSLTFDKQDDITTIPAIMRSMGCTEKPAEIPEIIEFEKELDKRFNQRTE